MGENYLFIWHDETPKSKVAADLLPFFNAVIEEVAKHIPEKGYGYKNPSWFDYFTEQAIKLSYQYHSNNNNPGEALDAAAMLGFAWLHETGNISINCADLRRDKP